MKLLDNLTNKDLHRREVFFEKELDYLMYKAISLNEKFDLNYRFFFAYLNKYKFTRIKNHCRITGKSRTVFKRLGLSRMPFKFYASSRMLSGFLRKNR